MSRQWKNGDLYIHNTGVYIYIDSSTGGVRINDPSQCPLVASSKWWTRSESKFVVNIRANLLDLSSDILKIVGESE